MYDNDGIIYYINIIIVHSLIFCQGDLLHAIQISKVFQSSKTFVDMKMKRQEGDILDEFRTLNSTFNGTIPLPELKNFIRTNFQRHTLDYWLPSDFSNHLQIIDFVQNYKYK